MSGIKHPFETIYRVAAYVARWPLRYLNGDDWLRSNLDQVLDAVGAESILQIYGLEFRNCPKPLKVQDLLLVTLMQILILIALLGVAWWAWAATNDYVYPAFIFISVFHAVPSEREFLAHSYTQKNEQSWLSPGSELFSFVISLPALIVALPAAVLWGLIGAVKYQLSKAGR